LTNDEEKRFDRRRYIFQKANADLGTQDRFRVLLRMRDRAFFLKTIQELGATNAIPDIEALEGSQFRIATNARYYRERLEQLAESKRDALVAFLIQRCYLVVVAVPTAEAARRIFTVLNARGLDLTPTDILKADLLDRVPETAEMALAERWEAIEHEAGRDGMVELFGHIRMIFEREKPRLALEAGFPKFVKPFGGDAEKFMSELLEPIAEAFALLKVNDSLKRLFGSEAAKAVRSLNRIDNKDWVPPALMEIWKREPTGKDVVSGFLAKLERLAYFLFVTRAGVNDRIARFATVMNQMVPNTKTIASSLELSDFEEAKFLEALDNDIYLKSRVCKPVLQRLDEALSSGGATYDDVVSIEHVLPQTVEDGSEWAKLFPNELIRNEWTHKLANLVLLTTRINIKASNWDFEKKKTKYFSSEDRSSPFVITQDVLQTKAWNLDHLKERQQKLLQKLAEVWDLDFSKFQNLDGFEEEDNSNVTGGFTEGALIEAKRQSIIKALSAREGAVLSKTDGALFSTSDGKMKAICTISKRYPTGAPYWYGYAPRWDQFLSKATTSFIVLGCMDRDRAYAIPHDRISKLLPHLHKSGDRHWHLVLEENAAGQIELAIPKTGSKIGLTEFEVKIDE
jgi:Protein of unknown function (DUF1524)